MARKIALVILSHECEEDPCHVNNATQEGWIRKHIQELEKLKWNWELNKVRVVDLKGEESIRSWDTQIDKELS